MSHHTDIVVIGGGLIGTSAALELTRRGYNVTVVEARPEPGQGSTAHSTAIIRQLYHEKHSMALAVEGLRFWESWPEPLGTVPAPHARFIQAGVLWVFERHDLAHQPLDTLRALGAELEVLAPEALADRFPHHRFDPPAGGANRELAGVLETKGGFVDDPALAVRNLADAAKAAGVTFLLGDKVALAEHDDSAVAQGGRRRITAVHTTSGRRLTAHAFLNAAGPHSDAVNRIAGAPLPLLTAPNIQNFFDAKETALPWSTAARTTFPVCADPVAGLYFKPDAARFRVGAVLASDDVYFSPDADRHAPPADAEFLSDKRARLASRLPAAQLTNEQPGGAYYDVTVADWSPIIDRTDVDGWFVCIGTSGKWFKAGPVLGWLTAELMTHVFNGHDPDRADQRLVVTLPLTGNPLALADFARWRVPHRTHGVLA